MEVLVERRASPEHALAERLAWPLRLSRRDAWRLVLVAFWLTSVADLLTGTELWLGPVYLLIISFAAWSLGWAVAVGIGLSCLGLTLAANGSELYPYGGVSQVSNIAVRVLVVFVFVGLLHTVRQMYAREWRVSRIDPLTTALNRKAFFELTSARASSRAWSVLVFADMDGFKPLNDERGHAAGDDCLVRFVHSVRQSVRKDDVFARLGGDEFAIYLDVKDETCAMAVAVRLHQAMNAVALADGTPIKCSVGALLLPPGLRSIDDEVRGADLLMYEAKGLGSSLVVGTASRDKGGLVIHRHWGLTPETRSMQTANELLRATTDDARHYRDLRKVA